MDVALDTFHLNCFSSRESQEVCLQLMIFLQIFIFFTTIKAHSEMREFCFKRPTQCPSNYELEESLTTNAKLVYL